MHIAWISAFFTFFTKTRWRGGRTGIPSIMHIVLICLLFFYCDYWLFNGTKYQIIKRNPIIQTILQKKTYFPIKLSRCNKDGYYVILVSSFIHSQPAEVSDIIPKKAPPKPSQTHPNPPKPT